MSTTSTPTKTVANSLLSLQSVASNTVVISSVVDVSTAWGISVFIQFGRRATSALTTAVEFRLEASAKSSGDDFWFPASSFTTNTAAAESEAVSGTVNAGTNVITVASTTNLTTADYIFIDNGTIANSEWAKIKAVSTNTSVTIEDNLVNAQTGSTIYDQAQIFPPVVVDCSSFGRMRLVMDASGSGQATAVQAYYNLFTAVTTA